MPKFTVQAVMRTYLSATFEAPDLEAAKQKARELDGADFIEDKDGHEWETFCYDLQQLPEEGPS